MSGPDPEALKAWAEGRSLAWKETDTIRAVTQRLRLGLGVGEHRASYRQTSDRGMTTITGSMRKKPERETVGVARGMLPGGLEGVVGHHVHLTDEGSGSEDRYQAITDTLVFAELPHRARPVFHLEGRPATEGDVKAGIWIGGRSESEMSSPLDGIVPPTQGNEEAGGMEWVSFPAEPGERVRRIASSSTRFLDGLPADRIEVEYECGKLAVWVKGRALTDQSELDQLCRFASSLAAGMGEVADSSPALDLAAPLPMPEPDARARWVEAGADLVEWAEPPVSVVAAQERYKKDVQPHANRTGWKVYGIVAVVLFVLGLLIAAGSLGLSLVFDDYPMPIAVMIAVVSVGAGAIAANRIGLQAGQDALDDRLSSSAIPWGIEAFGRGYAEHAGLTHEDHEELRRRLEVPFDGRPQIAWQGELAPGVPGHVSTWIDATNSPEPPRFYLLAATVPTGAPAPAGYESVEKAGTRLTWQEVTTVQRAQHRLDQLRAAAG